MPFVPVLCVRWAVAAAPGAAQPDWIHNFCNGQVSQLLDPTERWARFDIVGTMLVVGTMHVRCLCTCICPLDSINSDFSVEKFPPGGSSSAVTVGDFLVD